MIQMNKELCVGCGLCAKECYPEYLTMGEEYPILPEYGCMECGHCIAICPNQALSMTGEGYTPDEVLPYDESMMQIDAKQLSQFMRYRRSVRHYKPDAIPHDVLLQVLEEGRYSPTGSNTQSVRYIVLEQDKMQYMKLAAEALWQSAQASGQPPTKVVEKIYQNSCNGEDKLFHGAPAVILILDTERRNNYSNAYIAASRIELMAQSLGLGTCYIGLFLHAMAYNPKIAELLDLPEGYQVQAVLAIGYPEDQFMRTAPRKPLSVEWK